MRSPATDPARLRVAVAPRPAAAGRRTETVDYALVLEGEIHIILDREERLMKQGDFLVERGTNHAWANRSGKVCTMLFVLIDGKFDPEIGKHFA